MAVWRVARQRGEWKADTVPRTRAKEGGIRVTEEPRASRARGKCSLKLWGYSYCQTHRPDAKREWRSNTPAFLGPHTLPSAVLLVWPLAEPRRDPEITGSGKK